MDRKDKSAAIVDAATYLYEEHPFASSSLRNRFHQWGQNTGEMFLKTLEDLGFTIIPRQDATHKMVSAARILQQRAKEYQRVAESMDTSEPGAMSSKAMTLVDADACDEAAQFLLEACGRDV